MAESKDAWKSETCTETEPCSHCKEICPKCGKPRGDCDQGYAAALATQAVRAIKTEPCVFVILISVAHSQSMLSNAERSQLPDLLREMADDIEVSLVRPGQVH